MSKATELESKVLRSIATNSYNECNYDTPATFEYAANPIWMNLINDSGIPSGVTGKSLSGVCSSLSKKKFASSYEDGNDSTIMMTEEGWNAMIEFFGSHEECFKGNK